MRLFARQVEQLHEPVNDYKEPQPYNVYEMPIPRDSLESKMVLWLEVSLYATAQNYRQHDYTQRDMKAVKTGKHEEGGPKYYR